MNKAASRARRSGAKFLRLAALSVAATALLVNPLTLRAWRGANAINYLDVTWSYMGWAVGLGLVLFGLSRKVARGKSWADGASLLSLMVTGIILLDRLLLVWLGLPLWKHDSELNYVQRPGVVRNLGIAGREDDLVVINGWGQHDTEFPERKPPGELRGLMLGDSVTMGFGVTYAETFSARLEAILAQSDGSHSAYNMINTGVHGYATYQERIVFERSLRWEPDFVVLGFCMNDVTEPYVADADFGGAGLDYHGVTQTPSTLVGWLVNETGVGRLTQRWAQRGKSIEVEKRTEVFNVLAMSRAGRNDPQYDEAWDIVLRTMDQIYDLAEREQLPIVLAVFPYVHQLRDEGARAPNEILAAHAAARGVDVLDLTDPFRDAVFADPTTLRALTAKGASDEEILAAYDTSVRTYFFDDDHFTRSGNALVAEHLYAWMLEQGLASAR